MKFKAWILLWKQLRFINIKKQFPNTHIKQTFVALKNLFRTGRLKWRPIYATIFALIFLISVEDPLIFLLFDRYAHFLWSIVKRAQCFLKIVFAEQVIAGFLVRIGIYMMEIFLLYSEHLNSWDFQYLALNLVFFFNQHINWFLFELLL